MPIHANVLQQAMQPWLEGQYKGMGERAEAYSQEPYRGYPGIRYAELPQDILDAFEMTRQSKNSWQPQFQQAQQLYNQNLKQFPDVAKQYMNPYMRDVINKLKESSGELYREQLAPELENRFVGAGLHGSSLHKEFGQRQARDINKAFEEQKAKLMHQGYEHAGKMYTADRAAAGELGGRLTSLGGLTQASKLADAAALSSQGAQQMQHEQGRINTKMGQFNEERNFPFNQLQQQSAVMNAMPAPVVSGYGASQTPGVPQWNTAGELANIAGSLGAASMAYGRKKGGAVKKTMNIPKIKGLAVFGDSKQAKPKRNQKAKKMGLGNLSFSQSSLMRQPKVGAKKGMGKLKGSAY